MEGVRRRYNIGKYVAKKYGTARAYRRRITPMSVIPYKQTRVARYTKTQLTSIKSTFNTNVNIPAGTSSYAFGNGQAYFNLAAILQASNEWVSRSTQYSYYKINGMSVTYTRQWIDPIAYGVNGVSSGFLAASYRLGLGSLNTNFYPNLTSTTIGATVQDADSSWITSPFIHGRQSHYQPFPRGFTTGTNSNGLGVWNACNQVANLSGELAIFGSAVPQVSDDGDMIIFDVEINVYVSFCNNTGT